MSKKSIFYFGLIFSFLFINCSIANTTNEEKKFEPFTGKIIGSKVRLRIEPDLNSHIIKELNKKDYLLVVGEDNDFWAVEPPHNIKAYVFRSYVLDNTIEAQRVNIRLYPDVNSPIICQMHAGDKIEGKVSDENRKWLEIIPPSNTKFYVAKEYLSYAGDKHFLSQMEQKKEEVEKLLNSAFFITQEECKKPFDEMQPQNAISQFEAIIQGYLDFDEHVKQAKEGLALLQDTYLQKKIAYLESKNELTEEVKKEIFSQMNKIEKTEVKDYSSDPKAPVKSEPTLWGANGKYIDDKVIAPPSTASWAIVEKDLYISWNSYHPDKSIKDFYQEQEVNSEILEGVLEHFSYDIKNKPGDYVLRFEETKVPIAFLYSTHVNLEKYVGQIIKVKASPRPNNNFAFPAYFVNSVD